MEGITKATKAEQKDKHAICASVFTAGHLVGSFEELESMQVACDD